MICLPTSLHLLNYSGTLGAKFKPDAERNFIRPPFVILQVHSSKVSLQQNFPTCPTCYNILSFQGLNISAAFAPQFVCAVHHILLRTVGSY